MISISRPNFILSLRSVHFFLLSFLLLVNCTTKHAIRTSIDTDRDSGHDGDSNKSPRPVIMLTGYWSPTGLMMQKFSQDESLNETGWMGKNWENLGYDIISFYPNPTNESYVGDFEVDYQDSSEDFWHYTNLLKPIAIISFGRGASYSTSWEIEYNARNLTRWSSDSSHPLLPTPNPPDNTVATEFVRHSTLPVEDIATHINRLNLPGIGTNGAFVDWRGNPGAYLCEFMAYHGMWYQSICKNDPTCPCLMAGFIHVHDSVSVESASLALEETLRVVIESLQSKR